MSAGSRKSTFVGSASHVVPTSLTHISAGWVDQDLLAVRKLAVAGAGAGEMAAALGWSEARVTNYIKRNKIVWNRPHSGHLREAGIPDPKLHRGPRASSKPPKPISDRERQKRCADALLAAHVNAAHTKNSSEA